MPSSVIRAARYDPDQEQLDILFTTGRRYLYSGVPPEAAERFAAAFSKGRHFNAHIRDLYPFVEVAPADRRPARRETSRAALRSSAVPSSKKGA